MANGTDALEIALQAIGIGPGHEVIVPANTFFATAEAVANIGATPVFVDCEPNFYNIDVDKIEEKITPRTRAIIPVHLYGLPAEMDGVVAIARKTRSAISAREASRGAKAPMVPIAPVQALGLIH